MKTYTIKPLEWKDFEPKHQFRSSNASGLPLMGMYYVLENHFDEWRWQFGLERVHFVKTLADGKAAAEAHYIQQIEKALKATT